MVIIAHPETPEEEVASITEKLSGIITKLKGEVVKLEKWGKRKLAYPIKKNLKGYYLVLFFRGDSQVVKELERVSRLNDKILRCQTARFDQIFSTEEKLADK